MNNFAAKNVCSYMLKLVCSFCAVQNVHEAFTGPMTAFRDNESGARVTKYLTIYHKFILILT